MENIESTQMLPEDAMKTYIEIQNLYPNPTTDKLIISWENRLDDTEDIKKLEILIFDITGVEKMRKPVSSSYGKQSQEIMLPELKSGIYYIKLQRDEKYSTQVHKFVVFE